MQTAVFDRLTIFEDGESEEAVIFIFMETGNYAKGGNMATKVISGRCYFYNPAPIIGVDEACNWCGFVFGKDHQKDWRLPDLVCVVHPAREGVTSSCPACHTYEDLNPAEWSRVAMILNTATLVSFVQNKWLTLATPDQIIEFSTIKEDEADGRRLDGGGFAGLLGGLFDDNEDDDDEVAEEESSHQLLAAPDDDDAR